MYTRNQLVRWKRAPRRSAASFDKRYGKQRGILERNGLIKTLLLLSNWHTVVDTVWSPCSMFSQARSPSCRETHVVVPCFCEVIIHIFLDHLFDDILRAPAVSVSVPSGSRLCVTVVCNVLAGETLYFYNQSSKGVQVKPGKIRSSRQRQ